MKRIIHLCLFYLLLVCHSKGVEGSEAAGEEEDELCEECAEFLSQLLDELKLHHEKSYNGSITPYCNTCDIRLMDELKVYDDACNSGKDGCYEQIIPLTVTKVNLSCECIFDTKNGKENGRLRAIVENPVFSLMQKNCGKDVEMSIHESGDIAADKLHIICDGDDDYVNACNEKSHSLNIDNIINSVANTVADVILQKNAKDAALFNCREHFQKEKI